MTRRSLQAPLAALLLAGGMLLPATTGTGTTGNEADPALQSALAPPVFSIQVRPGHVYMRGTTASAAHEAALLRLVAERFSSHAVAADFSPGVIVAADWESASTRLLHALEAAESARAIMRKDVVEIRSATSKPAEFAFRMESLRDVLSSADALVTDIVTITSATPHDALCRQAFGQLTMQPISFGQSSAELRSSSHGTLDRIVEFANDCRKVQIAITGHTDASGGDAWNRYLSLQRAQAVADYLTSSGVAAHRLQVRGLGAAAPIADNTTAHGRSRNRRIEFTLP